MAAVPKHMRRRFQFTIGTVLLVVTVFGVWLVYLIRQSQEQKAAIAAIALIDGYFYYDFQYDPPETYRPGASPPGPQWLWKVVDKDLVFDVVAVGLNSKPATDAILERVGRLSQLQQLDLASAKAITDVGLRHLATLHHLTYLRVDGTSISQSAIDDYKRSHPKVHLEQ
jgi:hypothetical protein